MDDLPEPPDLLSRKITIIEHSESFFRTHSIHRGPIYFGDTRLNRFDSPDSKFKVMYAACDPYCAFIETFAWAAGTQIVSTDQLRARALSVLKPSRPLHLVDLCGPGSLVRIGADGRLFSGSHVVAQKWSKALHDHPASPDGLLYPSRLDPTRKGLALFHDRGLKITELQRQGWYGTGPIRRTLIQILDHYGLALVENAVVVARKPPAGVRQERLFPDE